MCIFVTLNSSVIKPLAVVIRFEQYNKYINCRHLKGSVVPVTYVIHSMEAHFWVQHLSLSTTINKCGIVTAENDMTI